MLEGRGVLYVESFEELVGVAFEGGALECAEHELFSEFVHAWFTCNEFVCEFVPRAEFAGVDDQVCGDVLYPECLCQWAFFGVFAEEVDEWCGECAEQLVELPGGVSVVGFEE